ncbi:MAG: response regulator transcription factor [Bacteroidales bacterium]|nr:response regulator transcription factor [Bacteroidales bacterium]
MEETARILIIEDEKKVAAFIQKGLEEHNFKVDIAYDGLAGKEKAFKENYDLIILDIKLPLMDGFEVCQAIRRTNLQVPILMLTAMGSLEDKVKGFDFGADDYLLKPFEFDELLVRIRALLKRSFQRITKEPEAKIQIADLIIDRNAKIAIRSGKKVDLTAKEYALLEYLALNEGKVISRLELTEKIWGVDFDTGTNVVDVYINFLRKKIDTGFSKRLIHTRVGLGYMLKDEEENI